MITEKKILDACCGGRMMWFDKQHPSTLYVDIRVEEPGVCKERPHFSVQPDMLADFRKLPFPDKSFKLIVWDPPHITRKDGQKNLTGILVKKYGALHAETWQDDLKRGFNELWRVLDDDGVLIFKFHDGSVSFEKVLSLFHTQPLFGTVTHKTAKKVQAQTKWFCFMKVKA